MTSKAVPALGGGYFKVTFLRAPSAQQALFASEQMIDELAHAANMDPVAFRRQNIATSGDPRPDRPEAAPGSACSTRSPRPRWKPKVAASSLGSGNVVTGRGVALGGFANSQVGLVADVTVNKKTGKISVTHLYGAHRSTGSRSAPGSSRTRCRGT